MSDEATKVVSDKAEELLDRYAAASIDYEEGRIEGAEYGKACDDLEAYVGGLETEIQRLRNLCVVRVLCGACGRRYSYNSADDLFGRLAADKHTETCSGQKQKGGGAS